MRAVASRDATGQAEFSAALLDPDRSCPEGLRAWNGSDPTLRLAVHRNNVVGSLIDALADTCPVVRQLVGDEFFRAMAGVFARQSPPRTRVLAHYGADLPSFIATFEPARSVPYLADVAQLEVARVRAYHAADAEPVTSDVVGMALTHGERTGELRLTCHPSLSAFKARYAAISVWAAHQGEGDLHAVDVDRPETVVVVRQGLDVLVLRAPDGAADFVAAIQTGSSLDDAAAAASAAAAHFDLAATLSLLLAHGALTSIHLPQRLTS